MDRRIFGDSRAGRAQVPNTTAVERWLSELVTEEAWITGLNSYPRESTTVMNSTIIIIIIIILRKYF
jgi:hypothetical protein